LPKTAGKTGPPGTLALVGVITDKRRASRIKNVGENTNVGSLADVIISLPNKKKKPRDRMIHEAFSFP
jgi:hypothetical protein